MSQEPREGDPNGSPPPLLPRHDAGFVPPHRPTSGARPGAEGGGATQADPTGPGRADEPARTGGPGSHDRASGGSSFPGTDDVDAAQVFSGPGYTSQRPSNDPVAVAAMVFGVAGLIPLVGLVAIVCGHVAVRRLRTSRRGGAGLAVAGLVLGYVLTGLWVLFYLATRALPT